MALTYTYCRPAGVEDELSAYFASRLGLTRGVEAEAFPLHGDRWWVGHYFDTGDERGEEAVRIGIGPTDEVSVLVFEQRKFLSAEEYSRSLLDLYGAVLDQLNETPGLTGVLAFDIDVLIERRPGGPTCIDSALADPEDGNKEHHIDSILNRGTIADLTDFD